MSTRKSILRLAATLFLTGWYLCPFAQQLNYTSLEAEAIHDSINKSRWDVGGRLSHYSFRYMSEFFPVAVIQKSRKPYSFPVNSKKSFDKIVVKSKEDTLSFENYLKKEHVSGIIVVHKGSIVYEKYLTMLPGDQHTLQSITKVITSTLITSLINEKKIAIDEPIETYIPELKGSDWQGISVRNILHMKSGMDIKSVDFESGPFTNPKHKNYQLESALGVLPRADNTPASVFQFLKEMKKDTAVGLEPAYSNINTFMLGWLAEKVTGKKYADLVSERIWQPMGASSDGYVCLSNSGIPWPHGGMSVTLRDLARFGMLYTKSEIKARKESLVSFAQLKEIFDAPALQNSFAPFKWAYQWDLASDGLMMKGGFGGQTLFIDPENETVIASFNFIDFDWSMSFFSVSALAEIRKAAKADK